MISVPRPAILVAMVTAPISPAWAIISASRAWFLAFNTSCLILFLVNILLINSLVSIAIVPIKIGWPNLWRSSTTLTIALYFPSLPGYNKSVASSRITGLFVGIVITYIL